MKFDLKDDESDSIEEQESKEEDPAFSSIEEIGLGNKETRKV
jgi:hypothetical protein